MKYLQIIVAPDAMQDEVHFLLNQLMNRIHGIIRKNKLNIGIDFPQATNISNGRLLRLFSTSENDLNTVKNNDGILNFVKRGMFVIKDQILDVPENALQYRIAPCRSANKNYVKKKIKRQQKFFIEKGLDKKELKKAMEQYREIMHKKLHTPTPYFLVNKDDRKIPIHYKSFQADNISENKFNFNSYGLCNLDTFIYRF